MRKFSVECFAFMILVLCCILLGGCGREGSGGAGEPAGHGTEAFQGSITTQQSGPAQQGSSAQQAGGTQQGSQSPAQQGSLARPQASGTEKPEVLARQEQILDMNQEDGIFDCYGIPLKMQFFRGEPVLLFLKEYGTAYVGQEEEKQDTSGLYVYKMDGSRELMIPGEPLSRIFEMEKVCNMFVMGHPEVDWYLDEEGCLYCAPWMIKAESADETLFFLKVDASGELVFLHTLEPEVYVEDFLCLEGGKMYAVLWNSKAQKGDAAERVVEFDPATGEFSEKDTFLLPYERRSFISAYGEGEDGGLYLYGYEGIQKVDLEDGSLSDVMSFAGSTYSMKDTKGMRIQDFRMLWDGSAELLHFEGSSSVPVRSAGGIRESIFLEDSSKTPVVLRASEASGWLKSQAAAFNSVSPSWRVVMEESGSSGAVDAEEYARQTSIEIAAGKGPDILCGDLMGEYFGSLAGKGALLDLGPYMEGSGIREEDFLPAAFGGWRDGKTEGGPSGIYGVSPVIYPYGYKIRAEVLEGVQGVSGSGAADIGVLLDALEAWGEDAAYYTFCDAGQILELFLEGSESLWGMVDWEAGSCDFSGELFGRMLEAARRFGYNPRHKYPNLVQYRRYDGLLRYDSLLDLEAEGMAPSGVLFDDGCRGAADLRRMLAINADSARKEGAWEFIRFLLDEDAQMEAESSVPVNRAVLEAWAEAQLEEALNQLEETNAQPGSGEKRIWLGDTYIDGGEMVSVEKIFTERELTQGRVEEYLEALGEVRSLPVWARPVLDIVLEEAGSYFNGDKDIREVSAVIENRVQLYLDENGL